MNLSTTRFAIVLLPLLVAACASGGEVESDAEGAGGSDAVEAGGADGASDSEDVEGLDELGRPAVRGDAKPASFENVQPINGEGTTSGAGGEGGAGSGTTSTTGDTTSSADATTGSGAGGGGEGGAAPEPSDACPGDLPYMIGLDAAATVIEGTLVGAADDLDTCFTDPEVADGTEDGADRVYAFSLQSAGLFTVKLDGADGFNPALVVRDSCADTVDGSDRLDEYCHSIGNGAQVHRSTRQAGTVYVIVDAAAAATGTFTLTATLTSPICGDGVVGPGEDCDAGKAAAGDGCGDPGASNACLTEPQTGASGDTCALAEAHNIPSGPFALTGLTRSTTGFSDDAIGTCMPAGGGADRVFRLMPQATGMMRVRVGMDDAGANFLCSSDPASPGCYDVELYARSTCASDAPEDEIACSSDCCDGETLLFPVTAFEEVFLFVDGYDSEYYSMGPFNLHFDITPSGG